MRIRMAVSAAALLAVAGCSGTASPRAAEATSPATTTSPPTTTTASGTDQQVCSAVQAIEARAFDATSEELVQVGEIGRDATTPDIAEQSRALLDAMVAAGLAGLAERDQSSHLRRAREAVENLLVVCRQSGYI
jgi:hypothetical protein